MNTDTSWLKLSVAEFFNQCNWFGQTLTLPDWLPASSQPIPLTVSVAKFFQALPWEGKPTVGSLPKPPSTPPLEALQEPKETTLADFMDLF
ncbi:MAG: hypothetical protein N3E45_10795 [Oscillatoriaceae bacterium SKW80]|nr:hypothetical protein [Oscillatoriaceae bacterium SKYG93]MCX8121299.1 hypothetical protein [Oscillatoriaceae bacterium SKW80]MDW8453367.1 hypothetical protein [Oscillatoriaceae cyanobacterium SKYGB_i_bin93]HIK26721.1 hypothetical protein [Oscillatoriaceae cyanobacterium M7585_C2015_266]